MLKCNSCKKEKKLTEFTKSSVERKRCKDCVKIYNKNYRINNKEKCKKYNQTEKYKQKRKEYKLKNKLRLQEIARIYFQNNKEKQKEYYEQNKEKIKEYNRKWYNDNKDRLNSEFREKYANNPALKLRRLISGRITEWLGKLGTTKKGESCSKYLSYTMEELKSHIEKQFEPWMTWKNWGKYDPQTWNDEDQSTWKWQLDHIIPQINLPYESMADDNFQKCWNLDNLRPYSAKLNIHEGARLARKNK